MKTIAELLELTNKAILTRSSLGVKEWFISYSGHVNTIEISYYASGWDYATKKGYNAESVRMNLDNPESIQEGFRFIKNRL